MATWRSSTSRSTATRTLMPLATSDPRPRGVNGPAWHLCGRTRETRMASPSPITHASDEYVTMTDLCARLSICRRTVTNHDLYRYAIRVGSQWRFRWSDILRHYGARPRTDAQR